MSEKKKLMTILGVTLAVYLGIRFLLPFVIPFLIAWILVKLLNPLVALIRRRIPMKKELLAGIILTGIFLLAGAALYFLAGALMDQISRFVTRFDYYYDCVCAFVDDCCGMLENRMGLPDGKIGTVVSLEMEQAVSGIERTITPDLLNRSFQYLMKLVNWAGLVFIIFIGAILLMRDYEEIKSKLEKYRLYQAVRRIGRRIWSTGGSYLKSQLIIIGIITVMCVAGLYLLGNSYALVLGIVIGILDALPFLGTGTILLPWAVVLMIRGEYWLALGYAALFLVTNTARELLEPRLIGKRIGIYPFVLALSVYVGLCLFGPFGVFTGPAGLVLIMEICREIMGEGERDLGK